MAHRRASHRRGRIPQTTTTTTTRGTDQPNPWRHLPLASRRDRAPSRHQRTPSPQRRRSSRRRRRRASPSRHRRPRRKSRWNRPSRRRHPACRPIKKMSVRPQHHKALEAPRRRPSAADLPSTIRRERPTFLLPARSPLRLRQKTSRARRPSRPLVACASGSKRSKGGSARRRTRRAASTRSRSSRRWPSTSRSASPPSGPGSRTWAVRSRRGRGQRWMHAGSRCGRRPRDTACGSETTRSTRCDRTPTGGSICRQSRTARTL
mmetsp:Transcript_16040/g.64761  ORF Transcript_16040/g.64761 Transcript_16040/m.64761 type:complete len:263 (-) Transcript_16040:396-1184(-)